MSIVNSLFEQAQLAEAAYASFINASGELLVNPDDIKAALQDINNNMNFSVTQATEFVTHWQVVSQYTASGELLGDGSGFSGTLFQNKATGEYTFALRGTEPGYADLLGADFGDIVSDGLTMDQIVDMYNYWQSLHSFGTYQAAKLETSLTETAELQLLQAAAANPLNINAQLVYKAYLDTLKQSGAILDSTLAGTLVRRITFGDSNTLLANTPLAQGSGKLSLGDTVNVTGHSLGGHLAAAFTRLFDTVGATATTINGAGFPTGFTPGVSLPSPPSK